MPRRTTAFAALCATLCAQDGRWSIPERGVAEYERRTETFELLRGAQLGELGERVLPAGRDGGHTWRAYEYTILPPPEGWEQPGFDDAAWTASASGFGGEAGKNPRHRSEWTKTRICLRARFPALKARPKAVALTICHDDDVEVWLNGTSVLREGGYVEYRHHLLDAKLLDALTKGENLLALRCTNTGGAQFVDAGLTAFRRALPAAEYMQALGDGSTDVESVRAALFPFVQSPALLLEGELDDRKQQMAAPPRDLRDLGAWVAFDLRGLAAERSVRAMAPRMHGVGDVLLSGRIPAPDAAGRQKLVLQVQSGEIAAGDDGKRWVERHLEPHRGYQLSGQLEIERTVDPAGGVVREVRTRLLASVVASRAPQPPIGLDLAQTWKLVRRRENRDVEFREAVRAAIDRGSGWLRGKVAASVAELRGGVQDQRSYGSGRLALALLAIVKGGASTTDPLMARAFDELRRRELVDTYSLAHAIMAVEARWTRPDERDDLLSGRLPAPRQRELPVEDREALQRWTEQLRQNVDSRVDPAYLLRFSYVPEARFDHSVNQYGLLGLYSAQLCGQPIGPSVWRAAGAHLLQAQDKPRKPIRLQLHGYRDIEAAAASRTVAAPQLTPAAGWSYLMPRAEDGVSEVIWGSMTASGVTGLTLCREGLIGLGLAKDPTIPKLDAAARSGFAWLAEHFAVRHHPGHPHGWHHLYYWLYGLERSCELAQVAWINGRDWYFEGAMTLLAWQNADGSWPADPAEQQLEGTAMAVLFLKKAAPPVYTR